MPGPFHFTLRQVVLKPSDLRLDSKAYGHLDEQEENKRHDKAAWPTLIASSKLSSAPIRTIIRPLATWA
jgi:hypothetical protein